MKLYCYVHLNLTENSVRAGVYDTNITKLTRMFKPGYVTALVATSEAETSEEAYKELYMHPDVRSLVMASKIPLKLGDWSFLRHQEDWHGHRDADAIKVNTKSNKLHEIIPLLEARTWSAH